MLKKGLLYSWVEEASLGLLVFGFFLGFAIRNQTYSYIIVFLCGIVGGLWVYKSRLALTLLLPMFSFMLGYVIGNQVADIFLLSAIFVAGTLLSYNFFSRKLVKNI